MAEVAEDYNLDLLHVHYAIPHSISAMLAQQMMAPARRLPFITTLHGTDITWLALDRSYFPITKFSIEKSDGITSISEDLRRHTYRSVRRQERNPRDQQFRQRAICTSRCETRDNADKRLIHISNFRPVKRVLDCIRILAEVRKRSGRAICIWSGMDQSVVPAQRLARELGVEPHVIFMGKQDHVERLIPLNHVLLLPSEMESFGLAALEGMACGVPPVSTRVGGVPELVTHGVDGFLEAVGDVSAQAARVVELLSDEPMYTRMSQAARKSAVERFSTDLVIPQYEQYYRDVCERAC